MKGPLILASVLFLALMLPFLIPRSSRWKALRRQTSLLGMLFLLSLGGVLLAWLGDRKLFSFPELTYIWWLLFYLLLMVLAVRLARWLIFDLLLAASRPGRFKLLEDVSIILLYGLGLIILADTYLGVKVTPLLATSAVLTVVAGFALQDILGDLFAGIALHFEESLKIGDWITVGSQEGEIEELRWRSIKIRTRDRSLVLIPNQTAAKEVVVDFGAAPQTFSARIQVGLSYDTPPDRAIDALLQAARETPGILSDPEPLAFLEEFSDSAITYAIRLWLSDCARRDRILGEYRRRLWYRLQRQSIGIPFPIRDVRISRQPQAQPQTQTVLQIMEANPLLTLLDRSAREQLAPHLRLHRYGQGETLTLEDTSNDALFVLVSGNASVSRKGNILAHLGPGEYMGEMSLFTGPPATATTRIEHEALVLILDGDSFRRTIRVNEAVMERISERIAQRREGLRHQESGGSRERNGQERQSDEHNRHNIFLRIRRYFSDTGG